jgi:hypothetical protein
MKMKIGDQGGTKPKEALPAPWPAADRGPEITEK